MKYTQKSLSVMTNQNLNIALQDKLGIGWVIKPENNEENTWAYKFSDYVLGDFSKTELPNFCAGCKELCDLIVRYRLTVEEMLDGDEELWGVSHSGDVYYIHPNPWRAVVEYLLLEVEL